MHIAPIWTQIHDWVADNLPGAMISDVATATRLVHLDVTRGQELGRRNQVRPRDPGFDTQRDHVWMFEEKKQIRNAARTPLLDERALHLMRGRVWDDPKPPDL